MSNANPYASSAFVPAAPRPEAVRPSRFCLVMFGFSLFCCFLRIPFWGLAILEAMGRGMGSDPALAVTALPVIATSGGIILFGMTANPLLLARIRYGIPLAALLVLSTIASIGVEIWFTLLVRSLPAYRGGPAHDVFNAAVLLFRMSLLALYLAALNDFARRSRPPATVEGDTDAQVRGA